MANPRIHPQSFVDPAARIGSGVEIGPGVVVGPNVELGDGVRVGPHAVLTGWTKIGEETRIWPGAVIGEEPQDRRYRGQRSYVVVGPRCQIREYVTIHCGTQEESVTEIGAECFLMGSSHVAHNCRLARGVTLVNGALLGGHSEIGEHAIVSANAVVHQFARIGTRVMIGGASRVPRDVPPYLLLKNDGEIQGLNLVGLRRSSTAKAALRELREIYALLRAAEQEFDATVRRIRALVRTPEGKQVADFLSAPSKRGITLPRAPL